MLANRLGLRKWWQKGLLSAVLVLPSVEFVYRVCKKPIEKTGLEVLLGIANLARNLKPGQLMVVQRREEKDRQLFTVRIYQLPKEDSNDSGTV